MLAKPMWVVMMETSQSMIGSYINDQGMMVCGLEKRNKESIEYSMIIERSGMEWNGMDVCRSNAGITDQNKNQNQNQNQNQSRYLL